jgi:hypothetical protein
MLQILEQIQYLNLFESSMNFKGVQTIWEKSDEFFKILP